MPHQVPALPHTVILASRQYPQGRALWARQHVIADLIRNPEGWCVTRGNNKPKPTIFPLSLDGRGIKGEGESKTTHPYTP